MEFCELVSSLKMKTLKWLCTFILNIYESVHPPWLYTFCVLSVLFTYTSVHVYTKCFFSDKIPHYKSMHCTSCTNMSLVWMNKLNWMEAYHHNTKNKFKFYFLIITEIIRKDIVSLNFAIMKKYIVIPQRGFVIERKNRNYIKINSLLQESYFIFTRKDSCYRS